MVLGPQKVILARNRVV